MVEGIGLLMRVQIADYHSKRILSRNIMYVSKIIVFKGLVELMKRVTKVGCESGLNKPFTLSH